MSALKICPQCGTEYELDQRFCPKDGSTLKSQSATADIVGDVIAERYHVLKKLGEGGMGAVYLAEHVKMGRKSAVKIMNPGMVNDADAIQRFNREATNASRITHPNVAAIYDFGETREGLIYLAMEFIEGDSLTAVIERLGALPPQRAANIAFQTSEGLVVAHDMGIVHRDLKPDNIMIAKNRDGSDCVKVVDFGIAKATENQNQKVTKTGLVVGTPEYMSPEQLAGDKLDGRSDIYSLGLVTFNMLTGKLPFPSETVQESMIMRLTDRPRTLVEMTGQEHWPQALQDVLDKALARDAGERYQNAGQFGRDLLKAVESIPASALADGGTLVLGAVSVPATRVAGAAGAGKTAAVPSPRSAPAPAAVPATPVAARSNKMPMIAGGGAVAAALIGFLVFKSMGSNGSEPGKSAGMSGSVAGVTDNTRPASQDTVVGSGAPPVAAPVETKQAETKAANLTPGSGNTVRVASTETPPKQSPVNARALIEKWEKLTDALDDSKAQQVLSEVGRELPRFRTHEDSVGAELQMAWAHGILGHEDTACKIIKRISRRAETTRYAEGISSFLSKSESCQL